MTKVVYGQQNKNTFIRHELYTNPISHCFNLTIIVHEKDIFKVACFFCLKLPKTAKVPFRNVRMTSLLFVRVYPNFFESWS